MRSTAIPITAAGCVAAIVLARPQPQVRIRRAQNHAHHQTQQHRAQRELLHLHAGRNESLCSLTYSFAFTFSLIHFAVDRLARQLRSARLSSTSPIIVCGRGGPGLGEGGVESRPASLPRSRRPADNSR